MASTAQRPAILVVGDIMLDRYLWGKVHRISPEAPVPVILLESETIAVGGAANVARNLALLGATTSIVGTIGVDDAGLQLLGELEQHAVVTRYIVRTSRRTTVKTRVVGGHQHMVRIDSEDSTALNAEQEQKIIASVQQAFADQKLAAVVISDYGKGIVSELICQFVIAEAQRCGIPVLVDPKGTDYRKYRNATTLCPNRQELMQATGANANDLESLLHKGAELREQLDLKFLVVTLSEMGIALLGEGTEIFPAQTREVFDVSGAGDTVMATLALAMASGLPTRDAVVLANLAAGIVVGKLGTVPISAAELLQKIDSDEQQRQSNQSIFSRAQLIEAVLQWKQRGERVIFTNGCFDLIHVGHVRLLQDAKKLGTRLVVAINSDASVKRLKGPERPIVNENNRAEILSHLASVDAVTIFDEDTPLEVIQAIRPQVIVKGGDYTEATVVGAEEVKSWGGRVQLIPLIEGQSTTKIVERAGKK